MSLNGWPPRITSSPKHWLDRAKKAREAAEAMGDPDFKRTILEVAAGYERSSEFQHKKGEQIGDHPRSKDAHGDQDGFPDVAHQCRCPFGSS